MTWWTVGTIAVSTLVGQDSARKAANQQKDAANQAAQTQKDTFDKQSELLKSYRGAGESAQTRLLDLLGLSGNKNAEGFGSLNNPYSSFQFNPSQLANTPGYQFSLDQGLKSLERTAAARGGLLSGNALASSQAFGQGLANQNYGDEFSRQLNLYNSNIATGQTNRSNVLNPLLALLSSGQASAAGTAAAAGNLGNNLANLYTSAGAAQAAGTVGQTNALTSGVNSYLKYNQDQSLIDAYKARTASAYK